MKQIKIKTPIFFKSSKAFFFAENVNSCDEYCRSHEDEKLVAIKNKNTTYEIIDKSYKY